MPELLTLQDLANGHLDVKALGEAANGDENTIVTTRTGNTYPSAERAINIMFQNGGLPAEPFATKAQMETDGTSLADGQLAMVHNDTANNGLYVKTAGAWVKALYDPLGQAKQYADSNPLFKPQKLPISGADANALMNGIFLIWRKSVADSMLNLPPVTADLKLGTIYSYNTEGIAYQLYVNYNTLEKWERTGNGGTIGASFAWQPWVRIIDNDFVSKQIKDSERVIVNLFKYRDLSSSYASVYQATLVEEQGSKVLRMNAGEISAVFYSQEIGDDYINIGDTVTLTASIFSDLLSDNGVSSGADITIQAQRSSGAVLATSILAGNSVANEWEQVQTSLNIPINTTKIVIRLVGRQASSVNKFKNVVLTSPSLKSKIIIDKYSSTEVSDTANTVYVSKTGSDINGGTQTAPLLTIQKAVDGLPNGGHIVVLDESDYREPISIATDAHIKISAVAGKRVNLFGSDKLVVTKTSGMTKVYQAPLAAKPVGMGGNRGKPVIFEWGTPSKPIVEAERHHLHRGLAYRLPYTEMFEAASKAELDTINGKWFWEAGVIYFSATDGGNATLKRYEARARPVLTHSKGSIELVRVTTWFSRNDGMTFNGLHTKRVACISYGAYANGFADNANFTESYKDVSGGNGNDGFNATVTDFTTNPEINDRLEQTYFDPYGHDNGDDGISDHYRADCTIYGGYFEYNTKADVVHVTGSNSVCYNTQTRGTLNGFYAATSPTGDVSRVKTVMRCVGTVAHGNGYPYRAADDAVIICDNTTAINPDGYGYYQTGTGAVYANDCKFIGNPAKAKSGNVVINNSDSLTP